MVPTLHGIEILSSSRSRGEMFSMIDPTSPATIPIIVKEIGAETRWAMTSTTPTADTAKARVPSKLLSRKRWDPNRRPTRAAQMSLMMRIEKAVMAMSFGNTRTLRQAAISTWEAPLSARRSTSNS